MAVTVYTPPPPMQKLRMTPTRFADNRPAWLITCPCCEGWWTLRPRPHGYARAAYAAALAHVRQHRDANRAAIQGV